MKKSIMMIAVVMLAFSGNVAAQTLEELAEIVRQAASSESQINQEREARFLQDRNNQRAT
jgi:ABC-type transporter MlaC component